MLSRARVVQAARKFSTNTKYTQLLSPLTLTGNVTLKNRVLMGSMHTGLEESSFMFLFPGKLDEMAAFYAERAKGQVGLIVTGGISPNFAGKGYPTAAKMSTTSESKQHQVVTSAVHEQGGKIAMQILHTGRYGYHPWLVSASAVKAPINSYTPKALSSVGVEETIDDFVRCAALARNAGYDGVEIMGSEGYLINQFLVQRTNKRTDEWGGSYENRMRLPVEIVRRVRLALGPDFIIIYRLSMLDLVSDGSSWEEVVDLAQRIKEAGASIINTGIGWHEARIPTIATMVPRGAFTWVTAKIKASLAERGVDIPLCTTNRINHPGTAEDILQKGQADMISMARPFLADPYLVAKAASGRENEINSCIGCNQACLDHIFVSKRASCLVNPVAAHETNLLLKPTTKPKKVAVIGAGPAGLACSTIAAERGHHVTLFDKDSAIGGQFNMAKIIPGKEEFHETIRYFSNRLVKLRVNVQLNTTIESTEQLRDFDSIVVATGVTPRTIPLPNKGTSNKVKVISYVDLLRGRFTAGKSVAVIGAGGIGFDTADYLSHSDNDDGDHAHDGLLPVQIEEKRVQRFLSEWDVDPQIRNRGGILAADHKKQEKSPRKIFLLQRKSGRLGAGLGKTTGWIHRSTLKRRSVEEISGCKYIETNDEGLVIEVKGKQQTLPVDTVVICAGQESLRDLYQPLLKQGKSVFLIGGAEQAGELDAKRAIDQGTRLAAVIETAKAGDVFEAPIDSGHEILKMWESLQSKFKKKNVN
jgi:2,4-dienoyl-CoA reductase (NADPH2)